MAAIDPTKVYRAPGRVAIGPTDLATAFPCGGTALGVMARFTLMPQESASLPRVTAEEYGGQTVEAIEIHGDVVAGCYLRQTDADVFNTLFSTTTESGGLRYIKWPGTRRDGALWSDKAAKLLFAPDDPNQPAVILYKALPMLQEGYALNMSIYGYAGYAAGLGMGMGFSELMYATMWVGLRDANGNIGQMGKLSLLSVGV